MEDAEMQMPRFRLDGTLTLGNVLQIASIIGGVFLLYTEGVKWKTEVDSWRVGVDASIKTTETSRANNLPRLNNLESSDRLQDGKISGIDRSLDKIESALQKTNDALTDIGKTVAVIEERTKKQ